MIAIDQYHDYVYQTPWGQLFYDLLWDQLNQIITPGMRILDFGSGFGKTAHHYAKTCQVTAYEPSAAMLARAETGFTQLTGDYVAQLADQQYDLILLHNVLEYVPEPAAILQDLAGHLTASGRFSIVKHNQLGHVFASAVLTDDPAKALSEYSGSTIASQSFGTMGLYPQAQLDEWLQPVQHIDRVFGLRTVFGLSANNEIKYSAAWHDNMFALEQRLSSDPQAKAVAFFQHVLTEAL